MKTNKEGIDIIKENEGLRLKAYLCPAGIPTIGYGSTYYEDGSRVGIKDAPITKERAEAILIATLPKYEHIVDTGITVAINENQFSSLVSFAYNMGGGNLLSSTLLKKVNSGDIGGASKEFAKWTKARVSGALIELEGLKRRRQAEKELFLKAPLH